MLTHPKQGDFLTNEIIWALSKGARLGPYSEEQKLILPTLLSQSRNLPQHDKALNQLGTVLLLSIYVYYTY